MTNGKSAQGRPQARDDSGVAVENSFFKFDALANDRGGAREVWSLDQKDPANPLDFTELPSGATVGLSSNGDILYKTVDAFDYLAEGETATDSFTYSIRMGNGAISTATVTVEIIGVDDPTRIESVSVKLQEGDDAADISTSGQLVITDPDSPATVVAGVRQGQYGTFTIEADGSWTYVADGAHDEFDDGKNYTEIFRVNSSDGTGKGTVFISIMGTADEGDPAQMPKFDGPDSAMILTNADFAFL
jgi:VCBS repeat-containing protein